jgi:hypothetical protein
MKRTLIALVASLLILGPLPSADGQGTSVRFQGRVLWIAGQTMMVALDDGPSVSIDLARVAQSDYHVLVQNDWVVVDAVISRGSRRVIATSVQRAGAPSPQAP